MKLNNKDHRLVEGRERKWRKAIALFVVINKQVWKSAVEGRRIHAFMERG